MRLQFCQLARDEIARTWASAHANTPLTLSHIISSIQIHGGLLALFSVWRTYRGVCMAAGPIMISMQIYIWLLSYSCFVEWGEFFFSISLCQQVAPLWGPLNPENADITAAFSTACDNMTTHLQLCVCVCVCVCVSWSLFKVSQAVLSMAFTVPSPPVEGPAERATLRDRVHGHFFMSCWCHGKKKEVKASVFPTWGLRVLSGGRSSVTCR